MALGYAGVALAVLALMLPSLLVMKKPKNCTHRQPGVFRAARLRSGWYWAVEWR